MALDEYVKKLKIVVDSKELAKFKTLSTQLFDNISNKFTDTIKKFFQDILAESKKLLDEMSSYDIANSYKVNSYARQLALQYGLSSSEAFAFNKVKNELGISSEEDLVMMNENQREKFAERIAYWNDKYQELSDSEYFETLQKFQLEMEEFKTEMELDVIKFFMDNKDTIKNFMSFAIDFMKETLLLIGQVLNFLGYDQSQKLNASDIVQNYGGSSVQNIKIDNTFNGIQATDRNELINAGKLTWVQLKKSMEV